MIEPRYPYAVKYPDDDEVFIGYWGDSDVWLRRSVVHKDMVLSQVIGADLRSTTYDVARLPEDLQVQARMVARLVFGAEL